MLVKFATGVTANEFFGALKAVGLKVRNTSDGLTVYRDGSAMCGATGCDRPAVINDNGAMYCPAHWSAKNEG